MQYQQTLRFILALLLLSPSAFAQSAAQQSAAPDVERLRAHVTYLASEKLEGRRTGTGGAQEAARYVAREFLRLGLRPGASISFTTRRGPNSVSGTLPSYLQPFPYVAGVELGQGNAMTATRRADSGSPGAPM